MTDDRNDPDNALWAVELVTVDGETHLSLLTGEKQLTKFVCVNAGDAAWFRISACPTEMLVAARIKETFGG